MVLPVARTPMPTPLRPLSPADVERIVAQDAGATAHADVAAEFTRVVSILEELLRRAEVAPDRVRAFRRAVGLARLHAVVACETLDPGEAPPPA